MKLRTRLFLSIGTIFLLAFGVSLFLEVYLTKKNLTKAENEVRQQILTLHEIRREQLQEFLRVSLAEDHAKIDSLLLRISRDPQLAATLFIEPKNLDLVAPANCAYLFKNDRWIDFFQTTKEGQLTSLLIPLDFPLRNADVIPITDEFGWVIDHHDKEMKNPWMGIQLPIVIEKDASYSMMVDEVIERDSHMMVLFDPQAIMNYQAPKDLTPRGEGVDINLLVSRLEKAAQYVREKGGSPNWMNEEIKAKHPYFSKEPEDLQIECLKEEGDIFNSHIIQLLQRDDQAIGVFVLASLFPSNAFGNSLFAPQAPKGILEVFNNGTQGNLILTNEIFFQKKAFDDSAYFSSHPGTKSCRDIGGSMALIFSENKKQLFLANTVKLAEGQGFLTIGIDLDDLLEGFVLSIHQAAFIVHEGRVTNALNPSGDPVLEADGTPFKPELLKTKNGILQWKGKNYVYQNITPYPSLDLHIFTLEPASEAFALVDSIQKGSRMVIDKVSLNMRVVAGASFILVLLLLHAISKQITKPIAKLAHVTEDVAAGKLEGIELPIPAKGRHDEVAILCQSFEKMITGLKEKEKVKGVLNKVVSAEIAQEILKGQVHLGGEERIVTVLFADIRNFTGMTENKPPKEVVEMLNACMTKVSHIIDEHGGVIDKYVGDEVMALFGAPLEKEDSTLNAIQAAWEMVEALRQWNKERTAKGWEAVEMGIGIHTGKMLAGNMGAENRLNYTVIGSNVNLAARLCSAAKGMEVLITKDTLDQPHVRENVEVEQLEPKSLKGFEESFVLYRVKRLKG